MSLNEVPGLLLPLAWHDLVRSWCQVISLQASGSCAAGPAGSAPGPANTLASLVESKQNTNDKLKAYLTDIMWIITRSLVLRLLEIRTAHRDRPAVHTRAGALQQQKAAELQQERASRPSGNLAPADMLDIYEYLWICVDIHGYILASSGSYPTCCTGLDNYLGYPYISIDI
jgi:hypothetical protein